MDSREGQTNAGRDAGREPFERIAALREALRGVVGPSTVDGEMAEDLVEAVALLERVRSAAAEIERGAESFDNTSQAAAYADVRDRLLAAEREIAKACEFLVGEHRRSLSYRHVPKDDVLGRLRSCRALLEAALGELTDEETAAPGTVGNRSVKDVLAHVVARERRAVGRLRRALRGERAEAGRAEEAFDADALRSRPLAEVREAFRASYEEVVTTLERMTDEEFDPAGPVVRALGDSIHGAIAGDTYGHYPEHVAAIRSLADKRDRPRRQ